MIPARGFAAYNHTSDLAPYDFERREVNENDVLVDIAYCGICHSDIHTVRNEWGEARFPVVPGHEIVGVVQQVGSKVTKYKVGDTVGVGCMVDSCRTCSNCKDGLEQYCEEDFTGTYNAPTRDGKSVTQGGYSNKIVVREEFVFRVPANLELSRVAPLLCAGITTYSPLRHWKVSTGHRVGVIGLGGLGHMAVKIAKAMGANVTVFTTSPNKVADAKALGADEVVITKNSDEMSKLKSNFNFIIDTVSAPHDLSAYLTLLKRDGQLCMVGASPDPFNVYSFTMIRNRRSLVGSLIGGIPETQEMLDFCGKHNIMSDIELIPIQDVNKAYERVLKSDVKYRFVIDMKSL